MKFRIIKPKRKKGVVEAKATSNHPNLEKAITRFNSAFEQVKNIVLDRSEEIDALKLCILIKEHMMMEGRYGIAKSMLAEEVCRRIVGSKLFEIQLMKGTQTDQVFGPMNAHVYRTEARWEHNTSGFLPEADFAFIDETYRGSDVLLGALMGILNERKFHNGPILMRCPLITAIGTTNFQTDTPELEAFHDRWLVRTKIEPLGQKNLRLKMLDNFRSRISIDGIEEEVSLITLDEIKALQSNLSEIDISEEMIGLFEELCQRTVIGLPGKPYLSDRRLCLTMKLVLAQTMMLGEWSVKPDHLEVAKYGICTLNDNIQAFNTAYESVVGNYEKNKTEFKNVGETRKWVDKLLGLYEENLSYESLEKLLIRTKDTYQTITSLSGDEAPKLPENQNAYDEMAQRLRALELEIEDSPNYKEKTERSKSASAKVKKAMKIEDESIADIDGIDTDV
jgi:MoxR-like ATPase